MRPWPPTPNPSSSTSPFTTMLKTSSASRSERRCQWAIMVGKRVSGFPRRTAEWSPSSPSAAASQTSTLTAAARRRALRPWPPSALPPPSASNSPSLKRIEVQLQVAGRLYSQTFTPGANLSTVFTWDGRDSYGRVAHGHQPASVRVGYVYPAVYHSPNSFFANFGFPGSVAIDGSKERFEATLWQQWQKSLEWDSFGTGLGGWSLSAHHDYDPIGHVIHFGDGTRRSAFSVSDVILPFAGSHNQGFSGDGGLATQAKLDGPSGLAAAPDGSLYICDG